MAGKEHGGAWIAGSDKPESTTVRIGFMPLADCAPLVMASVLGFDEKHGLRFVLSRELSWTGMRDRLASGELDAAHVLLGLLVGQQMGIGARTRQMAVLMNLNQNGQGITLAPGLDLEVVHTLGKRLRLAHTFPTGNHAMFLHYWLAARGIDPLRDCEMVTVPPSQMAASLAAGHIDGFCAGEPWGQRAVRAGAGVPAASSETIWPDHPGKVLGTRAQYAATHPHTCRAMVAALLDTARWLDASPLNREAAAEVLASPAWVGVDHGLLQYCLARGSHDIGDPADWRGHNGLRFFGGGAATFPWLSDTMWFLTQQRRWGLLRADPSWRAVAAEINRIDLYRDAALQAGVDVPAGPLRSSTLVDGRVWDGSDPAAYLASFGRAD